MGLFDFFKKKERENTSDTFGDNLISQKAACLNCGYIITFEEGASLAMDKGYSQKVMCKKCKGVFSVILTPRNMTLMR